MRLCCRLRVNLWSAISARFPPELRRSPSPLTWLQRRCPHTLWTTQVTWYVASFTLACVQFAEATHDARGSKCQDFYMCLPFYLTPTEKEQTDEVLRDEIVKVGTPYSTNEYTEHPDHHLCKSWNSLRQPWFKNNLEPYKWMTEVFSQFCLGRVICIRGPA